MPSVLTTPEIREKTSLTSARADVEPLPLIQSSGLRPTPYRAETPLDILARDYPDLHLRAMAWLG